MKFSVLKLRDGWVIRGTREIPRLYNWHKNKAIKLNTEIINYVLDCDGTMTLEEICRKHDVKKEVANKFFKQFIAAGAIEICDSYDKINIDVDLGLKEPWLREVHLDVTDHCNLRCKHCFWGENITHNRNLSTKDWEKVLKDLKSMGVGKVVISGGEAFSRNDILDIIKCCYQLKIFVGAIFTNGTIKNQNVADVVEYITEKALQTSFYISMDGYIKEQHDFIRGDGNFERTLNFVKMLVNNRKDNNANYRILINSIIHRKNYNHLIEWYDFLNNLGVDSWRFTTGRISGSLVKNVEEVKITSKECFSQYTELAKYAIEKYKNGEGINLNIENYFNTKYIERGKVFLFNEKCSICDYKYNACSIDPYGNVQFCTGWQEIKYGNVFEKFVSEIWYSEGLQNLKNFKIREITECQNCPYLKYCGGGCRLEAKDIYSKDKFVCENFKLFDECMVPLLRELNLEFVEA